MTTKSDLLECSILNFTQFGSKGFTLDELASSLGISKKTIYKYFDNKEDLVSQSLKHLLDKYLADIDGIINNATEDPIEKIILIYKKGFEYLKHFKPSFLFGIKKYYPKADKVFTDFSEQQVHGTILSLLKEAKQKGLLQENIQINLICDLYFLRIDNIAFKNDNLFDLYSNTVILNHLIVINLKGIVVDGYRNRFFDALAA
ncbi:TetR/AcrR family transcriptional regulator [uncultured Gelidibacter sp.]|uniref:TetR/AcrR family transcriptional regulator n=1 Tax=uncultured Gelidibacter sp. TaxID=259318 RepID=UPI00262666B5|nr:TetR/AcrR family transcriptional regulator [uncultured Gelidibacter sp.]